MMQSSEFSNNQFRLEGLEQVNTQGATCDTFRVKLYGKLHFLKRLKAEHAHDIRYQEALRKEFETGYRLEHPNLVRYISLDNDSILMEYVDGETLTQRLACHPDYFRKRKNRERFVSQLLDVIDYLHSHQILHLDLKPDNILFTRINDDVKLIDLGFCYTDSYVDTQGFTEGFAAPEQVNGNQADARTDIYAIGKILGLLPDHHIYNKVIARCTAENPEDRYQSVEDIVGDLRPKHRYWYVLVSLVIVVALLTAFWTLYPHQQKVSVPVIQEVPGDSLAIQSMDTLPQQPPVVTSVPAPRQKSPQPSVSIPKSSPQQMEKDLDRLMDAAYRSTIATFCDSVFPSLTVGRQWEKASSEFHAQSLQVAANLSKQYPDIPESVVVQHVESRFQSLVGYVFNKMRENGQNR